MVVPSVAVVTLSAATSRRAVSDFVSVWVWMGARGAAVVLMAALPSYLLTVRLRAR